VEEQRRKEVRRHLVYYLQVVSAISGKPRGRLGDLSADGMLLLTSSPFEVGKNYHLRVEMPEDDPEPLALTVRAECSWVRKDANPDITLAGFKFVQLTVPALKAINRLQKEYGFFDGQPLDDDE